ncbi:GAP family protein [Compostimonas suwonensis]|uniref:Sap-like sulfolipid-1-addressing protein n=1 Tax=Compostimonas suwonensis TaxID=1048394 RepID=A0A2M9BZN6_9MICO|nr:GAP family protein [Compostimonas suwonensis]PJJ63549.1 Sap-like sulfolipid-1-addressing protein [Compostimonas suwonensis]
MTAVIGHLLPIALAVALSTIPITATILVLLSPAKPRVSIALLAGWTAGIAGLAVVFTLGFKLIPSTSAADNSTILAVIELIVGAALVVFAIVDWRRRLHQAKKEGTPAWMRVLGTLSWWQALGVGLVLTLRPKGLLLSIAAGAEVGNAGLAVPEGAIAIAIYTLVGVSTVAIPVIARLVARERMEKPLTEVRGWITRNSGTVMLVVVLMTGVVIIGSGLSHL